MKQFQKPALQRSEECFHQGRVIEMERVFTRVAFVEIPVEDRHGTITHPLGENLQLSGRIGQVLQHVQAHHGVKAPGQWRGVQITGADQFPVQSHLGRARLDEGPVVGIEIHEPHLLHRWQGGCRQRMAADATTEVEHEATGKALLQPQGVGDVVGAAQMPGGEFQQVGGAHGVFVEAACPFCLEGTRMESRQLLGATW